MKKFIKCLNKLLRNIQQSFFSDVAGTLWFWMTLILAIVSALLVGLGAKLLGVLVARNEKKRSGTVIRRDTISNIRDSQM